MQDFTKYKGYRVWSFDKGWGIIIRVDLAEPYKVGVTFKNGRYEKYTRDGCISIADTQTLFFDEIKFNTPPAPKKIVEKEHVLYVNMWRYGPSDVHHQVFKTRDDAIGCASLDHIKIAHKVTIPYEEEE